MRKWLRENGAASFDFKNQDIILQDGLLFSIEKEIKQLRKVKNAKSTSNGMIAVELTKKKFKTECYKCKIWFRELEDLLEYLTKMKKMLNQLGYKTKQEKNNNKQ